MSDISCVIAGCPLKANPAAKFCADCGSNRADMIPPTVICDESPCGLRDDLTAKFCPGCGDSRSMREDSPHAKRMREAQQLALDKRNLAFEDARSTQNYSGRMDKVGQSTHEHRAAELRGQPLENAPPPPGRRMTPEEITRAGQRLRDAEAAARRPRPARDPKQSVGWDPEHRAISSLDGNLVEGELYDRMMPHGHGRTALRAGEGEHEIGRLSSGKIGADYHSHVRVLEYKFNHSTHPMGTARAFAESRQKQMADLAEKGNTNAWGFEKQEGDKNLPTPDEVAGVQKERIKRDAAKPRSKRRQDRMEREEEPEEESGFKHPAVSPRKKV